MGKLFKLFLLSSLGINLMSLNTHKNQANASLIVGLSIGGLEAVIPTYAGIGVGGIVALAGAPMIGLGIAALDSDGGKETKVVVPEDIRLDQDFLNSFVEVVKGNYSANSDLSSGVVRVEISDEDLRYLEDLAFLYGVSELDFEKFIEIYEEKN